MTQHFYERAVYSKIIRHLYQNENNVTHSKLHKLAFFCYANLLKSNLEEHNIVFEAWQYGPVNRAVYGSIRRMYNYDYPRFSENYNNDDKLSHEELKCIEEVIEMFGGLKDQFLSILIDEDIVKPGIQSPWKKHYLLNNNVFLIPTDEIRTFYDEHWWNSITDARILKIMQKKFGE